MSIDVDFSLALNDRTGKLFLGKDIISSLGNRVARVRYGRFHEFPHTDFMRRVAGRLTLKETVARVFRPRLSSLLPVIRDPRPTLHLDPLSVVRHRLEACLIMRRHHICTITHSPYFPPVWQASYAPGY